MLTTAGEACLTRGARVSWSAGKAVPDCGAAAACASLCSNSVVIAAPPAKPPEPAHGEQRDCEAAGASGRYRTALNDQTVLLRGDRRPSIGVGRTPPEIGQATGRESGCHYVYITVGTESH